MTDPSSSLSGDGEISLNAPKVLESGQSSSSRTLLAQSRTATAASASPAGEDFASIFLTPHRLFHRLDHETEEAYAARLLRGEQYHKQRQKWKVKLIDTVTAANTNRAKLKEEIETAMAEKQGKIYSERQINKAELASFGLTRAQWEDIPLEDPAREKILAKVAQKRTYLARRSHFRLLYERAADKQSVIEKAAHNGLTEQDLIRTKYTGGRKGAFERIKKARHDHLLEMKAQEELGKGKEPIPSSLDEIISQNHEEKTPPTAPVESSEEAGEILDRPLPTSWSKLQETFRSIFGDDEDVESSSDSDVG